MKKLKVLLVFIQLSVVEKIAYYRNVIAKLTGNVLFPTPDTPLTDTKTAVDKLETSYLAARDGSHTAISAMHAAEAEADDIFRIHAAYVERVADGDETNILSSGFHVSKQPIAPQKPALAVENGANSGSVKLVAKAIDRARAYIWEYSLDGVEWKTAGNSTASTFQLTGLTVATKYYFRVAAITPEGTTDFTAAVLKVVV